MKQVRQTAARLFFGNVALLLSSIMAVALATEGGLRLMVKPAIEAAGVIGRTKLPPLALVSPGDKAPTDFSAPLKDPELKGGGITLGDLTGLFEEDSEIGYVPKKSARSVNGWWQSNSLGAKSRREIKRTTSATTRALFFGESFTQASRSKFEDGWIERLQEMSREAEYVNFGVDGYGMGQSLLFFQRTERLLEYDAVVVTFVPRADLWRDVNCSRYIGQSWPSAHVMPRFAAEDGKLKLIPSPYANRDEYIADNTNGPSKRLRNHLKKYDHFYVPALHESDSALRRFLVWKLVMGTYGWRVWNRTHQLQTEPDSEAFTIVRLIFRQISQTASSKGAKLLVSVLPTHRDIRDDKNSQTFREKWDERIRILRSDGIMVVDMLPHLNTFTYEELDRGYDGSHYGPQSNFLIAKAMHKELTSLIDPNTN